jgi:GTP-binding protein HflX
MAKIYDNKEENEKAILVFVNENKKENASECLEELFGLCEAANIDGVGELIQNVHEFVSATLIGSGKLLELKQLVETHNADLVVFDNELSGRQIKNCEEVLGCRVATRSIVILDIFAKRASTLEGKKQTELAQLKYMKSRLVGSYIGGGKMKGGSGGVGMRGPGETKLELDRRKMEDKILKLERELFDIEKNQNTANKARNYNLQKSVAIVGYTNAGKSTLLNKITRAGVLEKDMLFATLDTVVRKVWLNENLTITLSDTVGFISKLPHEFVKAFKSTLNEAVNANLLLIVVDGSSKNALKELETTKQVLKEINANAKQFILVNKVDKVEKIAPANIEVIANKEGKQSIKPTANEIYETLKAQGESVFKISAKSGDGIDEVKKQIAIYFENK